KKKKQALSYLNNENQKTLREVSSLTLSLIKKSLNISVKVNV
ncbi:hypothetical protein HMPREF3187_01704, partial [Aerococcus christensenii]